MTEGQVLWNSCIDHVKSNKTSKYISFHAIKLIEAHVWINKTNKQKTYKSSLYMNYIICGTHLVNSFNAKHIVVDIKQHQLQENINTYYNTQQGSCLHKIRGGRGAQARHEGQKTIRSGSGTGPV